jgi:FlaA1/EpsC-like NDP-sugar epimerase
MQKNDGLSWLFLFVKLTTDILIINVAFLLGYFIKFNTLSINFFSVYSRVLILATSIWIIIFNLGGVYKFPKREAKRADNILATSFSITSAAFITLMMIFFLYKEATFSMDIVFYAWFSNLILINISRSIIWLCYVKIVNKGKH